MSDELDPQLIAKWVAGRLGPEDQRALDQWLAADPARASELEELRRVWRMAGDSAAEARATADPGEAERWAGVLRGIGEAESRPAIALAFSRRRRATWGRVAAGLAAAAAIVLVVGGGRWLAAYRSRGEVAQAPRPMRIYQTGRGERAEFRLADGTRVMLNVASRLSMPADFGERDRSVQLEGGAYFDVVHDASRPFSVRAGDAIASDLGTQFVVRAYPEDRHTRVVVRAGKVALRAAAADSADSDAATTLEPGQAGRLGATGRPMVERADTAADFAWTGGTLVLDGTPLVQALPALGRWFDLEFRLSDSAIGRIPVAATLVNQPTDDALRFLAASLGLSEVRQGRVVTFYPAEPRR